MTAARCIHGLPIAADGAGCERCGPVAQRATASTRPERADAHTERDRGMRAALDHAPAASWDTQVIDQAIKHLAATRDQFSANDLRELLPAVAGSVVGTRFMVLARRGLIERVGSAQTTHSAGHARRISMWRSTASHQPIPATREPAAEADDQHDDDPRSTPWWQR